MNEQIEKQAIEEMACENCVHYEGCLSAFRDSKDLGLYECSEEEYFAYADECRFFYRKQEWISVDERLPEKFTDVLCLYPSKNYGSNIVVDYMESDRGYFAEQFKYGEPTHWMPLPEPPKMKGYAE